MSGHRTAPEMLGTSVPSLTPNGIHVRGEDDLDGRGHAITLVASAQPARPESRSRDELLVRVLTLINESTDLHTTLQHALELVRVALRCQIVEVWLSAAEAGDVELECAATDGSPGSRAFEAAGRKIAAGSGPSMVGRAMKSGRGSMAPPTAAGDAADRDLEAVAAGVRCIMTFPIRGTGSIAGVLVAFHESPGRPPKDLLTAVQAVSRQLALFIDRAHAEIALHEFRHGTRRTGVNRCAHRSEEPP